MRDSVDDDILGLEAGSAVVEAVRNSVTAAFQHHFHQHDKVMVDTDRNESVTDFDSVVHT